MFLSLTTGQAKLGNPNITLVTILKSDFPNGNFGFRSPLNYRFPNPERLTQQTLTIERRGGLEGQQTVSHLHTSSFLLKMHLQVPVSDIMLIFLKIIFISQSKTIFHPCKHMKETSPVPVGCALSASMIKSWYPLL